VIVAVAADDVTNINLCFQAIWAVVGIYATTNPL